MKDLPVTAKKLNAWIDAHFNVIGSVSRAWLEFEFPVTIGFSTEQSQTTTLHRIAMVPLAFKGTEEECCTCLAAHLYFRITREQFLDACVPLFVRTEFQLQKDDFNPGVTYVYGRLAFWDSAKNEALVKLPCYKREGTIPNPAVMPDGWFDRA